jgi:hypothetical protein
MQKNNDLTSNKFSNEYIITHEKVDYINKALSNFDIKEKDIYFKSEYSSLYQDDLNKPLFYIYNDGSNFFFYPFLIHNIGNNNNFYDISTPYGYGGPIVNTDDLIFIKKSWNQLNFELKRLNVIAELIKFHPLIKNHLFLENIYEGKIINVCKTISLSIYANDDDDFLKNKYSYSNRKSIKKAKNHNCEIIISNESQYWHKFLELYESNLQKIGAKKKYFFKRSYYDEIKKSLNNDYQIISCKYKGEIISSILILHNNYYAHCHLIGSSDLSRKLSANNLLHHEVVNWCKNINIKVLHFGGGVGNDDQDPVFKFKKSFSDELNDFFIGERIINKHIYDKLVISNSKNKIVKNNIFKYRD